MEPQGFQVQPQSFDEWLNSSTLTSDLFYVIKDSVVAYMGPVFLGLFGKIIESLSTFHERNRPHGDLRKNVTVAITDMNYVRKPGRPPYVFVSIKKPPKYNSPAPSQDKAYEGILEDVRQLKKMVEDVLRQFPLPQGTSSLSSWELLQQPIYNTPSSKSLYAAKKMAFYFYTSPLFLPKEKICRLIHKFQEMRSRKVDKFDELIRSGSNVHETDVGDWVKRIPMDVNLAEDDEKQPVLRYLLYDREGEGEEEGKRPYQIQSRFKSREGVVPYMRIVNAHARENNQQEAAGKVATKLLVTLPDVLPKVHALVCQGLDNDEAANKDFIASLMKLLRHGPRGYKGFKVNP